MATQLPLQFHPVASAHQKTWLVLRFIWHLVPVTTSLDRLSLSMVALPTQDN
jgi:hypothetical protein